MRLVCLSDTHSQHKALALPEGDILIHAGDCTEGGTREETQDFLDWFGSQPHQHKILVPGNHDFFFESPENHILNKNGIQVLIDQELQLKGVHFYGSPYTPGMENWAFNRERGKEIREHWKKIPNNTNILITHTPPYGILDEIRSGAKFGCEELAKKLKSVQPQYHLFGHIHNASGSSSRSSTKFYNLSILDERARILHTPVCIDI